jgi:ribonuclease J
LLKIFLVSEETFPFSFLSFYIFRSFMFGRNTTTPSTDGNRAFGGGNQGRSRRRFFSRKPQPGTASATVLKPAYPKPEQSSSVTPQTPRAFQKPNADGLDTFLKGLDRPAAIRPHQASGSTLRFEPDRKFAQSKTGKLPLSAELKTSEEMRNTPSSRPVAARPGAPRPRFGGAEQLTQPGTGDRSGGRDQRPGGRTDRPRKKLTEADRKFIRAKQQQVIPINRNVTVKEGSVMKGSLPVAKNRLRIIPLGGNEEVGRNMTVFEYEQDIVIVDMGVQWPEEDMPGVDYIVPNVDYLKGKEDRIRGVIFTHGHLDHIGAAPILLKQLNYPPCIGRDFTLALIKHKVEDQEKGAAARLKFVRIKELTDTLRLGENFEASFFEVEHSIMDAIGIVLKTPSGTVIHMGDWTISNEPLDPTPITYTHLADLPRPTILMLESLGATKKGLPPSETVVHENFKTLLAKAPGRIIIGTFASQIRRVAYLLEYAEQLGKRVALEGYSMKMNIEVAKELGYIKTKKETLIPIADIHRYPDNQVVVICTGAQGETNAALSKIVTDTHRFLKLQKNDTIIFSSSVIPGNERSIQRLKDNLYRKCDNVIHSDIMDVHIGGHSTSEGIKEMLREVKPTYFLPVYANHYFLKESAKIAERIGFPKDNIFVLDNGHVMEIENNMPRVLPKKVDTSYVFIDGLGVGDIGQVVLRDRQMLSQDGMVVVNVILDSRSKKILGEVNITSRGFVHVKENFELLNETKRRVTKIIKDNTSKDTSIDWELLRNQIRDTVGQFLFVKTERRPMILPVVMEV